MKEIYELILNLLYMCLITKWRQHGSLTYSMYEIKRKLCQIIPQQKDVNSWLCHPVFLFVYVFMLQYRRGENPPPHTHTHAQREREREREIYPSICTSQMECGIYHPHSIWLVRMIDMWMCVLLFKITATALYAQFCVSQKIICCFSDNLIISPFAVSEYHNVLPQYSCLWFLPVNQFLHECCKSTQRVRDPLTLYLCTPAKLHNIAQMYVFLLWYYLTHNFHWRTYS
jgi:hypothetical protein